MQADIFAEKLDSLMDVTLAHLEAAKDGAQGAMLWPIVLLVFQRSMLRAHRCKFAQYLLWYLCLQVGSVQSAPGHVTHFWADALAQKTC